MSHYNVENLTNSNNATENITKDDIGPNCLKSLISRDEEGMLAGSDVEVDDVFCWVVEGVLILIAFCVGMFGNSFSIIIFSRQKVHRIFHHLLLLLAIFDMVSVIYFIVCV